MRDEAETRKMDDLLLPFLRKESETESQQTLEQLITEHATPIIKQVIGYRLRLSSIQARGGPSFMEFEDLQGEIVLKILSRLTDLKCNPNASPITDFRGYVAVVAHHTCSEWRRRRFAQYKRLKDQIRHVLSRQSEFAIWKNEPAGWLCGFANWQGQHSVGETTGLQDRLLPTLGAWRNASRVQQANIADLLEFIFKQANGPVQWAHLVHLVAWLGGTFSPELSGPQTHLEIEGLSETSAHTVSLEDKIEQQLYLKQLWSEICRLPFPHRAAVLLNLKVPNDQGIVVLLAELRIATIRQIGAALDQSPEEFAAIWNDLPWDDLRIAAFLGTTRQKVINLRKAARKLLVRRMKEISEFRSWDA